MPELVRLRPGHEAAVLDFEMLNRAYFAATISDRGDEFFADFPARFAAGLLDQAARRAAFYLLAAADGSVLGRFNLYRLSGGTAELGFRVAQAAAGQGIATFAVRELCLIASQQEGLHELTAAASASNVASQRVLAKSGFRTIGAADPAALGGRSGLAFVLDLSAGGAGSAAGW